MPVFQVVLKEVWERKLDIEAENREHAEQIARDGNFTDRERRTFEYQYTLDDETIISESMTPEPPQGRYTLSQIQDWGGVLQRETYPFGHCPTYRVQTPQLGMLALYQMKDGSFALWEEKADELRQTWRPRGQRDQYWYSINVGAETREEVQHVR